MTLIQILNSIYMGKKAIVNDNIEILDYEKEVVVFDEDNMTIKTIDSISINNGHLQINVERWE